MVANEKVEANDTTLGGNYHHVIREDLGRRIEIGILTYHGLPYLTCALDNVGNIEDTHGLDRHVVAVGLTLFVLEIDARNLHGVEFGS